MVIVDADDTNSDEDVIYICTTSARAAGGIDDEATAAPTPVPAHSDALKELCKKFKLLQAEAKQAGFAFRTGPGTLYVMPWCALPCSCSPFPSILPGYWKLQSQSACVVLLVICVQAPSSKGSLHVTLLYLL